MKLYQVVCEDYKAHKFIVRGSFYKKEEAARAFQVWTRNDVGLSHKVYRLVVFKI